MLDSLLPGVEQEHVEAKEIVMVHGEFQEHTIRVGTFEAVSYLS
jgi:hypothetical protein